MACSSWFSARFTLFKFFSAAASNSAVVCFCWLTCWLLTSAAMAVSGAPSTGLGGGGGAGTVGLAVGGGGRVFGGGRGRSGLRNFIRHRDRDGGSLRLWRKLWLFLFARHAQQQ